MKTKFSIILPVIICVLLWSALLPAHAQKDAFPYPALPDTLHRVEQRAAFLIEHYWDNYHFQDTLLLQNKEITEQGFVNFIDILARFDEPISQKGILAFTAKAFAEKPSKEIFENLIEQYLEDHESPMRNDKVYCLFLEDMMKLPYFDETEKIRIDFRLKTAKKNLPGTIARNFSFSLSEDENLSDRAKKQNDGKVHQLSDYKKQKVILYFYDPECDNCHKITAWLEQQHIPTDVKMLRIVADYHINDLYSLKAMPTIYLLDKGNIVILKDCTAEQLITTLQNSY